MLPKQLNAKGQCCGRKPLVYKRPPHLYCMKCNADFNGNYNGRDSTNDEGQSGSDRPALLLVLFIVCALFVYAVIPATENKIGGGYSLPYGLVDTIWVNLETESRDVLRSSIDKGTLNREERFSRGFVRVPHRIPLLVSDNSIKNHSGKSQSLDEDLEIFAAIMISLLGIILAVSGYWTLYFYSCLWLRGAVSLLVGLGMWGYGINWLLNCSVGVF